MGCRIEQYVLQAFKCTPVADSTIAILLAMGVIAFLLIGLAPFTFDFKAPLHWHVVRFTPINAVLNWVCFVPFGILIAQFTFVERPIAATAIFCILLSGSVEVLQLFVPGRFCSFQDLVLNTGGGITGAYLVSHYLVE